jgi:hypothetical protein
MTTAAHPIPDQHGVNLFDADPDFRRLLALYLPAELLGHLLPHLRHLGGLAGGVLDTLAQDADQLDLMVNLKEAQDLGNRYAAKWLDCARQRLRAAASPRHATSRSHRSPDRR